MSEGELDIQAVFMDRDGTIGGTGHFIHPRDFALYPMAQEAIHLLKRQYYPGICRYQSIPDFPGRSDSCRF